MSNNIVRGTMLLTGASFLSKFLGMIYVIPFNSLVGSTGGTLYSFAYIPYNILLSFSTIGVPLAVSKFVSKYNSLEDYETGLRMFRAGIMLMAVTGLITFLTLFFGAGSIAKYAVPNDLAMQQDTKMVIRMVSFALLIIPSMSIVRGFFQGYQSMGPTAVSQLVEQIVRIVFVLVSAFLTIKVFNGTIATAVGFATFAAFVGALGSCVVLYVYWKKRKRFIYENIEQQRYTHNIPMKDLFKELFSYAGPFIIVGLATTLYQLVDQFTFERAMYAIEQEDIWQVTYSAINLYGHKLIIIPGTIATGLSLAVLPAITKSFVSQNFRQVHQQINQSLQIIAVLVIPAAVGLMVLSDEIYGSLYGLDDIDITGPLLAWYAPVSLLFALFTVSSSILQGINEQRFTVVSLTAGLLLKIILNTQLIHLFGAKGAIFGTALAAGTAALLNLWQVNRSIEFSFKQLFKRALLVLIFSLIMAVSIWLLKFLFAFVFPYETVRWATIVVMIVCVLVGGFVYLWLAYASTLLEHVFGSELENKIIMRMRSIIRIFKR
ncbi:O-antigen/teichoic acid export membrane protein [Cerasibacillus quisquiliarum]|uniref:Putative cell division protein YtgP n=1 Tax=Cerasibacillus quisquiliarum TaxID=227865 RepID=A0A511V0R4_9BACI|nr:polysaccharide biosynthesis protein [Cerasibacillus quisquiliarum]MBB5147593.1 O-antigen/teichoic acid export membrane protein [Cerasibacillus quisquiliarum]GEN32495.1 putative cell division protein YtgP [Cerasibacillus quisquiliarum]